jgi:xylulose-5-phosphate/fructose-6-phosphate phosphoketolase
MYVTYESFAMVSASMTVQHSKWLEESLRLPWRNPVSSLNVMLTSTCWRNDHNGFSHQGPGLIDVMLSSARNRVANLPAAGRELPAVGSRSLFTQPQLREPDRDRQAAAAQYLDMDAAIEHCARGASIWEWAGNEDDHEPDVVAAAGDIPTMETLAAVQWLRARARDPSAHGECGRSDGDVPARAPSARYEQRPTL